MKIQNIEKENKLNNYIKLNKIIYNSEYSSKIKNFLFNFKLIDSNSHDLYIKKTNIFNFFIIIYYWIRFRCNIKFKI